MLPDLKELLQYNLPGLTIHAWDRDDSRLKESVEACREYSVEQYGVGKVKLQPTTNGAEVILIREA
jgi:hypothetical protein